MDETRETASADDFLPDYLCETISLAADANLVQATVEVLKTGRMTPLIKEELKCAIQNRRLSEGLDELTVTFDQPRDGQLRPDEEAKLERRRAQNRRAAQKFREKKKNVRECLYKESQSLETSNTSLRTEINDLTKERDELVKLLDDHQPDCVMRSRDRDCVIKSQESDCVMKSQEQDCVVKSQESVCVMKSQESVCVMKSQESVCVMKSQESVCTHTP